MDLLIAGYASRVAQNAQPQQPKEQAAPIAQQTFGPTTAEFNVLPGMQGRPLQQPTGFFDVLQNLAQSYLTGPK